MTPRELAAVALLAGELAGCAAATPLVVTDVRRDAAGRIMVERCAFVPPPAVWMEWQTVECESRPLDVSPPK